MRIVITGTPGVGKHTIVEILAKKMNLKIIDINDLVFKKNAIIGKDYALIADTEKMKSIIKEELNDDCLIVGHLAPYVLDAKDIDYVIVLRRSPYELEQVYIRRGYKKDKMKDNLSSEILGIIAYDCIANFGSNQIIEIDSTNKRPEDIINEILYYIERRESRVGIVDWLEVIKDDIDRFFDL